MSELEIFIACVLAIAGFVVTVGNAIKVVKETLAPQKQVKEKLEGHEREIAGLKVELAEIQAAQKVQLKAILQLLAHQLDGNHTQGLKESKTEIESWLIERK
jgi:hypothetical protein